MPPLLKKLIYPSLDALFYSFRETKLRTYDISNTVIVAGSGRGGSTWLSQIVGALPGYPVLWEPLHPGKNPECLQYGFGYNTYISHDLCTSQQRQYVEEILTGKRLSTRVTSALAFDIHKYVAFRGFLVKFVNANLLLYWLSSQFPIKTILMIRHPCAVVSSQLKHGAWHHITKEKLAFPTSVAAKYPHLQDIFNSIETPEELLTFAWVLKTYVPLIQPQPHPWCLLTYEDLVINGNYELERLFKYIGKDVPSGSYELLNKPSSTTQSDSNVALGHSRLSGWQKNLTAQQITRILDIVKLSGINFYTHELTPNNKLERFRTQGT